MIKTPSNEGSSSGVADVKYQKAIKQISKLISLNTTLKKEIGILQENYDKLRADHQSSQEKCNNLQFEMQQTKGSNYTTTPSLSIERKCGEESGIKNIIYKDHQASGSITEFIQNKRKIENLEFKLAQKDQKIQSLKKELESKVAQNVQIYRKYFNVSEELSKLKLSQNLKNFEAIDRQRRKLKKQLEKSEEWVRKISNDYEMLKKRIFSQKGSINANSIQMGISSSINQWHDPLSDFYLQKLKKSQAQVIRLRKEMSQRKIKYKNDLNKLRQQNQQKLKQLMYLTSFVQKQQAFIQKFVLIPKPQTA